MGFIMGYYMQFTDMKNKKTLTVVFIFCHKAKFLKNIYWNACEKLLMISVFVHFSAMNAFLLMLKQYKGILFFKETLFS